MNLAHVDRVRGDLPFEFPEHLQRWSPASTMGHFEFHEQRCKAAPARLKLVELQRMVVCDMCPNKGEKL